MPRSRRRSVGYRTFITCEDPRGVVEYGTIKKTNINLTQKDEVHGEKKAKSDHRRHKSLNLCSKEMQIGSVESQSPTSLQLLEVSRGAQKLNSVINSLSNGEHSRNNSTDLAQDLLKGALDLGDSLALLNRFQHSKHNDFVEEMKNVIRNGVSSSSKQEETSESSIVHSAPNKKNRKKKWPNLIAKLMGLEDSSFRSFPSKKQKKPSFDDVDKGVDDDIPPIVILRPSRFSCRDLEQPIVPKSRGEVFEEMFPGMSIRTNPLAQTNEAKPKGKSKHYKKQFFEKNCEEGQKLVKATAKSRSQFQPYDVRKGIKKSGKLVNKTSSIENANQRYREVTEEASQVEITVADYVVDDEQSSPSETPSQEHKRTDHVKLSHYDHLTNGNQCTYADKLRALLLSNPDYRLDHSEISRRHLLDTANELISLHGSKATSLEKLLDEVCDEIKDLKRYTTAEEDNHSADYRLIMLVKGDLRTTGMVGGMWDVGWIRSADEVQELSRDLEELVLDELIQEIFV